MIARADSGSAVSREQQSDDHPAPGRHRVPVLNLWFGVFGAPLAWSIHTVAATAINSAGCIVPRGESPQPGIQSGSATWFGILFVSITMLVLSIAALATAWKSWSAVHAHEEGKEHDLLDVGEGRARFMAMAGMLLSAIFILLIAMNSLTLFITPQCQP